MNPEDNPQLDQEFNQNEDAMQDVRDFEAEISAIKTLCSLRIVIIILAAVLEFGLMVFSMHLNGSYITTEGLLVLGLALLLPIVAIITSIALSRKKNQKLLALGITNEQVQASDIEGAKWSQILLYGVITLVLAILGIYSLPEIHAYIFFALAAASIMMLIMLFVDKKKG